MVQIVGRLTADAVVNTISAGRQVVNFSIAMNDSYKPKNGEVVKLTTYINCSYWINPALSPYLKKGLVVELAGRLGVNPYTDRQGGAKASITLNVSRVQLHGGASVQQEKNAAAPAIKEMADDLPF